MACAVALQMLPEGKSGTLVFDVTGFMRQIEPRLQGSKLPYGWSVTSDSIAARVAAVLAAGELVLLKPALPCKNRKPRRRSLIWDMWMRAFQLSHAKCE